ncbi:hypothetical protein CSKR_112105 [Clonorchis sinensis]|uniref:Uncharacterized protein n=1 Tax=Clonorchis sinensis TaxID=79923 RepID=A0A419Q2E2_CLOSI|nr:hypothetical protein CSKR_112105 [Clonorchis sinensis]
MSTAFLSSVSIQIARMSVWRCRVFGMIVSWRARWLKWLERELTDRKVRGSNPTSASRLPLSRLGQPGSIPGLVLPSVGMAARYRKGVTAEQFSLAGLGKSATEQLQYNRHFSRIMCPALEAALVGPCIAYGEPSFSEKNVGYGTQCGVV